MRLPILAVLVLATALPGCARLRESRINPLNWFGPAREVVVTDLYVRPNSEFVAGFMGEALLFPGEALANGMVRVGSLNVKTLHPVKPGPVKAAIRPETWIVGLTGAEGLEGVVTKQAYLGSVYELTVDTSLGPIFVVSTDVQRSWVLGDTLTLSLPASGISVVPM